MPLALVTGASKGIGLEFSRQLAAKGYDLAMVARSKDLLDEHADVIRRERGVQVHTLAEDLGSDGAAQRVADWVAGLDTGLEILVNNAGYALWDMFDELSLEGQTDMLVVNSRVPMELVHHLLPRLRERKQAYILNVASSSAYQAVATMSVYSATKAFVVLWSRGLARELRDTNVSVTCLSPGPTDTDFTKRADMGPLEATAAKFNMTPEAVARFGLKKMFRKKREVIPGFSNKIQAWAARHLPKKMIENIAANIYLKKLPERKK